MWHADLASVVSVLCDSYLLPMQDPSRKGMVLKYECMSKMINDESFDILSKACTHMFEKNSIAYNAQIGLQKRVLAHMLWF